VKGVDVRGKVLYSVIILFGLGLLVNFGVSTVFSQEKDKPQPLELDGTKWDIELTYFDAKKRKKTENDTLIFADRKIISDEYKKKGYGPSNYSLNVSEDGTTSFGTMQIFKNETSFWKGKVSPEGMLQGSLHVQDSKGKTKEYYLKGKLISGNLRRKGEKAPEPPPPASSEPSAQPEVEPQPLPTP